MANGGAPTAKRKLTSITILSFIGAAISFWQTKQFHETRSGVAGFHSFCNIGQSFDCTAIEMSPYAELFGVPLSSVAMAGYILILALAVFAMVDSYRRFSRRILVTLCSIALLFSVAYLSIMIGVIGKFCLLCLCVDAVNIAMFFVALKLPRDEEETGPGMTPTLVSIVGVVALAIGLISSRMLNPQQDLKRSDMDDMVESVLNAPAKAVEVPADAPVLGNPNAKVTIIKFSDYECPACKMAATALHPLFKRYEKDVKFVFVNFPLDQGCNPKIERKMHEFACEAASAAICAQAQGKFVDAYETLFENQEQFKAGQVADLLKTIPGLDLAQLKSCMTQPSTSDKIKRDVTAGNSADLRVTPTFFINGKRVEGGLPTNLWMEVIDKLLKQ